ncbi:MAG: hypothetical protein ACI9G6_002796, partial [Limisphaerales bacterium]
ESAKIRDSPFWRARRMQRKLDCKERLNASDRSNFLGTI